MGRETTPFHVGLTADAVIDAAVALTQESHLASWSIRDLAAHLGVAPSVVYHHVGGKDRIARHVVERALRDIAPPPADLPWEQWFRWLLESLWAPVTAHPGVASWLILHGPTFQTLIPVVDTGIAALQRAGSGKHTAFAYSALITTAMLTIAAGEERGRHADDGPRDHAAMMHEFHEAGAGSPGVAVLTAGLMAPLSAGGPQAEDVRHAYYLFIVDATIAGVAFVLGRGTHTE